MYRNYKPNCAGVNAGTNDSYTVTVTTINLNNIVTVPAGCGRVDIKIWGAGGGGGASTAQVGGNGAGGASIVITNLNVIPGQDFAVKIGGGGGGGGGAGTSQAGANGGAGGDTFSGTAGDNNALLASGGGGGTNSINGIGGLPNGLSGLFLTGGGGGNATNVTATPAAGGVSFIETTYVSGTGVTPGNSADASRGGAGDGATGAAATSQAGAAGVSGRAVFIFYNH